jgi:hypothetical protein
LYVQPLKIISRLICDLTSLYPIKPRLEARLPLAGEKECCPTKRPIPSTGFPSDVKAEVEDIPDEIMGDNQESTHAAKKQRLHVRLTEDQKDQLVGLIQENAHLYDKTNIQWLSKDFRRQTWQEIATKMNRSSKQLVPLHEKQIFFSNFL